MSKYGLSKSNIVYLAIRRSLGAGARWSLPLHLRGCLRNPDPDKVDDMVQIGEEVGAREPAVVAMLLNAGLLETKKKNLVRHYTSTQ